MSSSGCPRERIRENSMQSFSTCREHSSDSARQVSAIGWVPLPAGVPPVSLSLWYMAISPKYLFRSSTSSVLLTLLRNRR